MRQHTPEELATAKRILKESEPLFEQRKVREQAEKERWAHEIAMLERRVRDEYVEVDLGDGDTIALRSCLSDTEMEYLGTLQKRQNQPKLKKETKEEITYKILALTTANPILTEEWFRDNRDRYATDDMLRIVIGIYERQIQANKDRMERIKSVASFRPGDTRPELRGISPPPEDNGSEEVGGPP